MGQNFAWTHPMICYVCGKEIYGYCREDYVYMRPTLNGKKYFCKYSHMRQFDKEQGDEYWQRIGIENPSK